MTLENRRIKSTVNLNINTEILFVLGYLIAEKAIPYYNKYKYNLDWNYLEEIVTFRGSFAINGDVIHAYLAYNIVPIRQKCMIKDISRKLASVIDSTYRTNPFKPSG
jgi:hypothetical protein